MLSKNFLKSKKKKNYRQKGASKKPLQYPSNNIKPDVPFKITTVNNGKEKNVEVTTDDIYATIFSAYGIKNKNMYKLVAVKYGNVELSNGDTFSKFSISDGAKLHVTLPKEYTPPRSITDPGNPPPTPIYIGKPERKLSIKGLNLENSSEDDLESQSQVPRQAATTLQGLVKGKSVRKTVKNRYIMNRDKAATALQGLVKGKSNRNVVKMEKEKQIQKELENLAFRGKILLESHIFNKEHIDEVKLFVKIYLLDILGLHNCSDSKDFYENIGKKIIDNLDMDIRQENFHPSLDDFSKKIYVKSISDFYFLKNYEDYIDKDSPNFYELKDNYFNELGLEDEKENIYRYFKIYFLHSYFGDVFLGDDMIYSINYRFFLIVDILANLDLDLDGYLNKYFLEGKKEETSDEKLESKKITQQGLLSHSNDSSVSSTASEVHTHAHSDITSETDSLFEEDVLYNDGSTVTSGQTEEVFEPGARDGRGAATPSGGTGLPIFGQHKVMKGGTKRKREKKSQIEILYFNISKLITKELTSNNIEIKDGNEVNDESYMENLMENILKNYIIIDSKPTIPSETKQQKTENKPSAGTSARNENELLLDDEFIFWYFVDLIHDSSKDIKECYKKYNHHPIATKQGKKCTNITEATEEAKLDSKTWGPPWESKKNLTGKKCKIIDYIHYYFIEPIFKIDLNIFNALLRKYINIYTGNDNLYYEIQTGKNLSNNFHIILGKSENIYKGSDIKEYINNHIPCNIQTNNPDGILPEKESLLLIDTKTIASNMLQHTTPTYSNIANFVDPGREMAQSDLGNYLIKFINEIMQFNKNVTLDYNKLTDINKPVMGQNFYQDLTPVNFNLNIHDNMVAKIKMSFDIKDNKDVEQNNEVRNIIPIDCINTSIEFGGNLIKELLWNKKEIYINGISNNDVSTVLKDKDSLVFNKKDILNHQNIVSIFRFSKFLGDFTQIISTNECFNSFSENFDIIFNSNDENSLKILTYLNRMFWRVGAVGKKNHFYGCGNNFTINCEIIKKGGNNSYILEEKKPTSTCSGSSCLVQG